MSEQLVLIELELKCTCPKECDCEDPPREGIVKDLYLISNHCPEHNWTPDPYPDCPTHITMFTFDSYY